MPVLPTKLPNAGTTIFSLMSALAAQFVDTDRVEYLDNA